MLFLSRISRIWEGGRRGTLTGVILQGVGEKG